MAKTREELLSAYIDGELSESEAAAFADMLEHDPSLAAELERLQESDRLLIAALDDGIDGASDEAALRRFGLSEGEVVKVLPRPANENAPVWRRWALPAGGAIAAALALILVRPAPVGDPLQAPTVQRALDSTASLQMASLEGGASLIPRLSFRAADGRYCREFRFQEAKATNAIDAVACRGDDGWAVEAKATAAATDILDRGSIELAGAVEHPQLDAAFDRLGGGDPLGPNEEKRLIAHHWEGSRK